MPGVPLPGPSHWCCHTACKENLLAQEIRDAVDQRRVRDCVAGAVVFDLIRTWRLDSGDYASMAEAVVQGWERRCKELGAAALPKPGLMNSNLSDAEELLEVAA